MPSATATRTPLPADGVIDVTTLGVEYIDGSPVDTPLANLVVNLYRVEEIEECSGSFAPEDSDASLTTDENGHGSFLRIYPAAPIVSGREP